MKKVCRLNLGDVSTSMNYTRCHSELFVFDKIAERAKEIMQCNGISCSTDGSSEKVILEYINACNKIIIPGKRKVILSEELREKIQKRHFCVGSRIVDKDKSEEIVKLIERFQELFERGEKVEYHLSRQAFRGEKIDLLLNSWNIKHLHLSMLLSNAKSSMRKNRSEWLLFCIVTELQAYFMDVLPHPNKEQFMAYHFLKIAHRNKWMNYIGYSECREVLPETINIEIKNDEDIYNLYESHVNSGFKINGIVYSPYMGIASSGDTMEGSLKINKLRKFIREKLRINNLIVRDINFIKAQSFESIIYGYIFGKESEEYKIECKEFDNILGRLI